MTSVTPDMIRQMRTLRCEGMGLFQIGHRVGVCESTVRAYTRDAARKRTAARDAFIARLWREGVLTKEIGARLGVTSAAISIRAKTLGLPTRKKVRASWENMIE